MRPTATFFHNLGFVLAAALVAVLALRGVKTADALLANNADVRRSLELVSAVKTVRSSVLDIETGARGRRFVRRIATPEAERMPCRAARPGRLTGEIIVLVFVRFVVPETDAILVQRAASVAIRFRGASCNGRCLRFIVD